MTAECHLHFHTIYLHYHVIIVIKCDFCSSNLHTNQLPGVNFTSTNISEFLGNETHVLDAR